MSISYALSLKLLVNLCFRMDVFPDKPVQDHVVNAFSLLVNNSQVVSFFIEFQGDDSVTDRVHELAHGPC
jgi:hypothetical protein